MKLKLIIFALVLSLLFVACGDEKPKVDTYKLSGELNGEISNMTDPFGKTVYVKIFQSTYQQSSELLCEETSGDVYNTSTQFPSDSLIINYQISGIPEGSYKVCVFIDMNDNGVFNLIGEGFHHTKSITIDSNKVYNISDMDEYSYNNWVLFLK